MNDTDVLFPVMIQFVILGEDSQIIPPPAPEVFALVMVNPSNIEEEVSPLMKRNPLVLSAFSQSIVVTAAPLTDLTVIAFLLGVVAVEGCIVHTQDCVNALGDLAGTCFQDVTSNTAFDKILWPVWFRVIEVSKCLHGH